MLAPFLDNEVTLVARIDVAKINLDGFLGLNDVVTGSVGRSLQHLKPIAADMRKQFLAAGGTEIYLIHAITSEKSGALYLVAPLSASSRSDDLAKIKRGMEALQQASHKLAEEVYKKAQAEKPEAGSQKPEDAEAPAGKSNDDKVVDAEFKVQDDKK